MVPRVDNVSKRIPRVTHISFPFSSTVTVSVTLVVVSRTFHVSPVQPHSLIGGSGLQENWNPKLVELVGTSDDITDRGTVARPG